MTVVILGAGVVFLATFLGGVVGFAYGLVSFPLLLLIGVPLEQVVISNLLIALCTRIVVLFRRYQDVNWWRVASLAGGSIPGMVVGIYVLRSVDSYFIQIGAGIFIIAAVIALAARQKYAVVSTSASGGKTQALTLGAGILGGFLGVTTSMNGVPPAIMLTGSRVGARSMVADLAVYFIVGNLITLAVLSLSGRMPVVEVIPLIVVWIPVGIAGTLSGLASAPLLPQKVFNRLALALIFIAGIVCVGSA